ncbi:hypothetical protein ACLOJK_001931 [Asimina triloba]
MGAQRERENIRAFGGRIATLVRRSKSSVRGIAVPMQPFHDLKTHPMFGSDCLAALNVGSTILTASICCVCSEIGEMPAWTVTDVQSVVRYNLLNEESAAAGNKMDLRKTAISEQFSSNSKVVSGFGIGLVVSLVLFSLLLIDNPFQNSSFNDGGGSYASFPWFFPQSNAAVSASSPPESVGEEKVMERNRTEDLASEDKNAGVLSSSVGDGGVEKTQEGNSSKDLDKGSFLDGKEQEMEKTGLGNTSETVKDANFSSSWDRRDKIPEGNVSRNSGKGSSFDKEETAIEASKNGSSLTAGEGERIGEVTREGNFSSNLMTGVEMMNDTTHEGKSPPETKKDSSISKDNVFQSDERNKTLEGNLSKEAKEKGSESTNGSPPPQVGRGIPRKCDIFNGRWVRDEGKPLYSAGSCPHIDRDFDCRANGRPDDDFLKWRWQPNDCNIPSNCLKCASSIRVPKKRSRFLFFELTKNGMNATDFLERLRGKRLLFVGDSLNRNMWESLDYGCSIDFVQSPFLVMPSSTKRKEGEHETLRLDLMDDVARAYKGADILVFNTGHWWTHEKTSKGIDYYQEGNYVYPTLNVLEAYEKALKTWAKWIDKNIDAHKTRVFFRGYSLTHFR